MWKARELSESLARYVKEHPETAELPLQISLTFSKGPVSKRHARAELSSVGWHGNGVDGDSIGIALKITSDKG